MNRYFYLPNGLMKKVHLGGWKKQSFDSRDAEYSLKLHGSLLNIPASVDLRGWCSPVEDQGDLGSCTAHMFSGLVEYNEIKSHQGLTSSLHASTSPQVSTSNVLVNASGVLTFTTTVTPPSPTPTPPTPTPNPTPTPAPMLVKASRLFEYYATRKLEGTVGEDSGATIRDAIKAGVQYGVVNETSWEYDISKFTVNPPKTVWDAAVNHKIVSYHSISDGDIQTMKSVLASGFPIGFGFSVYSYMMTSDMASKGFLPLPTSGESLQGGHAVVLVGYDDKKGAFLVRNSWSPNWGQAGYFWMIYDYVRNTKLSSDFWVVQSSPI